MYHRGYGRQSVPLPMRSYYTAPVLYSTYTVPYSFRTSGMKRGKRSEP